MVVSPWSVRGLELLGGAACGLFEFPEAPASAGDVEDVGMVQEAAEDGGGQHLIAADNRASPSAS